jgi:hypothetical protein
MEQASFGAGLMMFAPFLKYIAPKWSGYRVFKDYLDFGRTVANVRFGIIILFTMFVSKLYYFQQYFGIICLLELSGRIFDS